MMADGDMSVYPVDAEYMNLMRIVSPSVEVREKYPEPVAYKAVSTFCIPATGSWVIDLRCIIESFLSVMMFVAPLFICMISHQ